MRATSRIVCLSNLTISWVCLLYTSSIYRFRLASPEIFIGKRGGFAPYTPGGPHPATVTLGHNFRSAGNIIDQINDVFACVMSRTVGDVDYNCLLYTSRCV